MRITRILSILFAISSIAIILIAICTDWNDGVFLPLGLALCLCSNACMLIHSVIRRKRK